MQIFKRKCKITFIRHGSTLYTEENRLFDEENYPPLNENGREEMVRIANWIKAKGLKIDKLYTSSALRNIQSARIISKICNEEYQILNNLKSRRSGLWSGLTYEQIEAKFPEMLEEYHQNSATFAPPGGETTLEVNSRVKEALNEIIEKNTGNRIIIVTHAEVIQAAIQAALDIPLENQFKVYIPTGSATQISYFKNWSSLVYSGYLPLE